MTVYITPSRRLASMRQAMDRMFEDAFTETPSERELLLAVDVTATDDGYTLKAFVPGLEADDLEIEIINNTVSIRGKFEGADEDAKCLVSELPVGSFSRVITLPTPLDASMAAANIKNGLLTLSVPKAEAHRPKTIKISAQ